MVVPPYLSYSLQYAPDTGSIAADSAHTFEIMETTRRSAADAHLRAFGRRVKVLRVQRDMTQEELALSAGFGRTIIGYIERAERDVGISHLWSLADALGVRVADLFEAET
jgi:DNA-binding XRE family transcriptional regulator